MPLTPKRDHLLEQRVKLEVYALLISGFRAYTEPALTWLFLIATLWGIFYQKKDKYLMLLRHIDDK